jgi:hypothetical protein
MIAAVREAFPSATLADLQLACLVGVDQVEMFEEALRENASGAFNKMVSGAPKEEITAAFDRIKLKAESVFPTVPDKSRS